MAAQKMGAPTIRTKELESLILQGSGWLLDCGRVQKTGISRQDVVYQNARGSRFIGQIHARVRASGTPQSSC